MLYILVKENLIITNRKVMEDFMNELSLFNTLFNSAFDGTMPEFNIHASPAMPKVDVMEMKDNYLLEMELPGLTEKDVNIELDRNVLTIASVKADKTEKAEKSEKSEKSKWLLRERRKMEFARRFTLPEDADVQAISAVFKNGILSVNIARKAIPAPKKIEIAVA